MTTQQITEQQQQRQIELLQHTLGAGPRKRKSSWGYRNHFCAAVGSDDQASFEKMVTTGLAERGGKINGETSQYYRATVEGCKLAGLGPRAIKRAFED